MKPILRKVDSGNNSFSIREDIYPFLYNHWHYHPEIELTFIRKGTGIRLVGDSMAPFEDGDLILLGSNLPHMWRSDSIYFKNIPTLNIEAIAIHFREDFWGSAFMQLPELRSIKEMLDIAKRGLKITGKTKDIVIDAMEKNIHVTGSKRVEFLLGILDIISRTNEYSLLATPGFNKTYDLTTTDKINLIYTYTFNNFKNNISIKDAAEAASLSPNSFCRYFKTRTLKTYWQFLLEIRIGYACKLLIENEKSVSQICYECGFNNLSNFNRQFKSLLNITPLQYAKSYTVHVHTFVA
ncbi:helix-turn-helix domain-containing protein [Mucilaginibacter corticis]|uniref:Helix-turn-helix domain-containing protein n=1 Tax=Mucilaginibacter corticis TaxID=2597670 RepID=A0A556MBS1_9SPHI|nr:AraC family transcriptional regulator [Mucilaginibacter corticis]TSJ37353.1 helix-turn-helix domain-containing protein [Mucilaginibacter corticis]